MFAEITANRIDPSGQRTFTSVCVAAFDLHTGLCGALGEREAERRPPLRKGIVASTSSARAADDAAAMKAKTRNPLKRVTDIIDLRFSLGKRNP